MGCFRTPNRQCLLTLKRASCPTASIVSVLSVITSICAIIRYTDFFLKEACEEDWIPIKDLCVLNTQYETNVDDAHEICASLNGMPPAIKDGMFLKGIMSITDATSFWMSHRDDYNNVYIPKSGSRRFDTYEEYNKDKHNCLVNLYGLMYHDCNKNVTVVCVKNMYNKQ
ncbi:putative EEV glycoprotein [Parapoxvirus red deer/HL953]|uniref:Putative EEV glycoprotein n=1 Tax=Parapoxvirus red deer/HL953 TaxID=1579460 RepID=A0A0A7MC74_9POXV|nr:putative EEV glycoprotein [Parapoxvirus red deer/HL953]AIZ77362.1 putative EEV glycoprotein [Parapoxvirus red deer/HL953]